MSEEEVRVPVLPAVCIYHDEEKYLIEVELAGVDKDKIHLEMSERGFCLRAPRDDIEYFGCWTLAHDVKPDEAKATFKNGLLTITVPLAKPMKGRVKLDIDENSIRDILSRYRVIAIVGLSREPSKDSHKVAKYLMEQGFKIIPINPNANKILGEKCHRSLLDIPADLQKTIEIIDIFRPSEEVPQIIEQAIQLRRIYGKPHVIWMQLGIVNEHAAKMAREDGFTVVMDRCIMREHMRLFKTNQ